MTHIPSTDGLFIDANGCPAERVVIDGIETIVHYDDIPESDVTTVQGIRCTTPVRTAIDVATRYSPAELEELVRELLDRRLCTVQEIRERVAKPDMRERRGAHLLREVVDRLGRS